MFGGQKETLVVLLFFSPFRAQAPFAGLDFHRDGLALEALQRLLAARRLLALGISAR